MADTVFKRLDYCNDFGFVMFLRVKIKNQQ